MTLRVDLPESAKERYSMARQMATTEETLDEILNVTMEEFGCAPVGYFPRLLEYPWILHQISQMKNVQHVADIGTGISPLPVALAKCGICVYTFDPGPVHRDWENLNNSTGWGYIDYGFRYNNIKSFNEYFTSDVVQGIRFDVIYSVSVVEHIPRSDRVRIWHEAAKVLSDEGRLVFTVDLKPYSNNIWNLSEGEIVEPPEIHGRISDIYQELRDAGFTVEASEVLRGVPASPVDLLFFIARRTRPTRLPRTPGRSASAVQSWLLRLTNRG